MFKKKFLILPKEIIYNLQFYIGDHKEVLAIDPSIDYFYHKTIKYNEKIPNKEKSKILKLQINNSLKNLYLFKNLTELECSFNQIEILHESLKNLEKLDCSFNKLTFLPESLTNLEELDCYSNELVSLPQSLTNLKKLVCSFNKIEFLPENLLDIDHIECTNFHYLNYLKIKNKKS